MEALDILNAGLSYTAHYPADSSALASCVTTEVQRMSGDLVSWKPIASLRPEPKPCRCCEPSHVQLVGGQQQTRFGFWEPLGQTNGGEHPIERREALGAHFGNDVPSAIGGVQRRDRRITAQRLQN